MSKNKRSRRSRAAGRTSPPPKASERARFGAALCLIVATAAAYWQVQSFPFVIYDDPLYVYENPQVLRGLSFEGMRWALTATAASNWHPITWVSHMFDVQIFGGDAAGRHHTTNALLHVLNSLLLFVAIGRMTGSHWRSLFVAAIFALHPLHVESVAWVSERKDVLSQLFWLLSILGYIQYARNGNRRGYAAALLFFACGLMTKPMLVTAPFLLLLLDYWPLRRWGNAPGVEQRPPARTLQQLFVEKVPFFLLTLVSSVITYQVQTVGQSVVAYPLAHRMATAVTAYARYIGKTFWPSDLAILYPNHVGMWTTLQVGSALALLVAVTAAVLLQARRPYLRVGWFWFLGTLTPVVGFVGIGGASMADRYMYMPMTGLLIMLAWGSVDLWRDGKRQRQALSAVALLAIAGCLWLTHQQVQHWSSSRALFKHALDVTQNNHVAHNNMGNVMEMAGDLAGAALEYQKATQVDRAYAPAYINLGNVHTQLGHYDEAISIYKQATRIVPTRPDVYRRLGHAQLRKQQVNDGITTLRQAVKVLPNDVLAYHDLGLGLGMRREFDEAIAVFQQGLALDPTNAWIHTSLGNVYLAQRKVAEAVNEHRLALSARPVAGAHMTLATSLMAAGQAEEAIVHLRETLRLDPQHRGAQEQLDLATALLEMTPP